MSALPGAEEPVMITYGLLFDIARYVSRSALLMLPLLRHEAGNDDDTITKECVDLIELGQRVSAVFATIATIERARR